MKILMLFLSFLFSSTVFSATDTLPPQEYSKNYMPRVVKVDATTMTLSDGTIWERVDVKEDLSKSWKLQDQILVKWDNSKSKYLLQNIQNKKGSFAELVKPSDSRIVTVTKDSLTLSDGSKFFYIPFIKTVQPRDFVLMSLNENEPGKSYPYFIVGYTKEGGAWKMTGEVQARLK